MTAWRAEDLLYLRLGTETPNWCLAADSDTLFLAAGRNEQGVAIRLSAAQLAKIRMAKDGVVKAMVSLVILGAHVQLYLVGQKVNDHVWKGVASGDPDFLRAAPGPMEQARPSTVIDLATRPRKQRQMSLS